MKREFSLFLLLSFVILFTLTKNKRKIKKKKKKTREVIFKWLDNLNWNFLFYRKNMKLDHSLERQIRKKDKTHAKLQTEK